ncbi:MAG: hypothetical protein IOD12_02995 [Silvanigrellales bacterium]|nr:hypothetical protein [Silvanigrellales bacterium]
MSRFRRSCSCVVSTASLALSASAFFGVFFAAPSAHAEGFEAHLASGLGLGFQNRNEYGTGSFSRFHPEFVTYGYLGGFLGPVWLRPGLRVAYASEQPEMPQGLRVEERDLSFGGELGFVYDWYVVPSLALGGGVISRQVKLVTKGVISSSENDISKKETLPFLHLQAGVGIPLWKGFMVVEPLYRYSWVERDARITYTYGLEMTFQIL